MRRKINWILGGLIALLGGCKSPQKAVQPSGIVALYGVPYATYDISGKVVDEQGKPIKNAEVQIKGYGHQIIGTKETDQKGRYSIVVSNLPTDTIWVVVDGKNNELTSDSTSIVIPKNGKNAKGFYRGEYSIDADIQLKK